MATRVLRGNDVHARTYIGARRILLFWFVAANI
jgi:hypothetical protein